MPSKLHPCYEHAALVLVASSESKGKISVRSALYAHQDKAGKDFHAAFALVMQLNQCRKQLLWKLLPSQVQHEKDSWPKLRQNLVLLALYDLALGSGKLRLIQADTGNSKVKLLPLYMHKAVIQLVQHNRRHISEQIEKEYGGKECAKKAILLQDKRQNADHANSSLLRYARVNKLKEPEGCEAVLNELQGLGYCLLNHWKHGINKSSPVSKVKPDSPPNKSQKVVAEESGDPKSKDLWVAKDDMIADLLVFPPDTKLYDTSLVKRGALILQDKGSCFAAAGLLESIECFAFNATQGDRIPALLDACSAPGNKTLHAADILESRLPDRNRDKPFPKAVVIGVERDETRHKLLSQRVRELGPSNETLSGIEVETLNWDFLELHGDHSKLKKFCIRAILLDPSCSGSGMKSRTDIGSQGSMDPNRLEKLCAFQKKALVHALTAFPDVCRVSYSTCSIHQPENEDVVSHALRAVNAEPADPYWELDKVMRHWSRRVFIRKRTGGIGFVAAKPLVSSQPQSSVDIKQESHTLARTGRPKARKSVNTKNHDVHNDKIKLRVGNGKVEKPQSSNRKFGRKWKRGVV